VNYLKYKKYIKENSNIFSPIYLFYLHTVYDMKKKDFKINLAAYRKNSLKAAGQKKFWIRK
jgi:hypothetical protein